MNLVFFSNIPAPYFVNYLNELGKYANVTVFFERKYALDRDDSWKSVNNKNFTHHFLDSKNYGTENAFSFEIISILKHIKNSIIVFANPMSLTGILGIFYCKIHKIKYVIQSEGGHIKNRKGLKEWIKKRVISNASLYLSGMSKENDYFIAYGANPSRVRYYPFASMYQKNILDKQPLIEEKLEIRKRFNINKKYVVLFVGSISYRKGVDVLIRAVSGFDNVETYIVGGQETEQLKKVREEFNVNSLHYIDFITQEELHEYYKMADLFVLPTREDTWGLVINEAMSFGLPVITTSMCVAGLQLIKNNINGYVVKNEDYVDIHNKIEYILTNPTLKATMGYNNLNKIKDYNYENMAKIIYDHLKELI